MTVMVFPGLRQVRMIFPAAPLRSEGAKIASEWAVNRPKR